ncbi:Peptide methionine sulfoxide reductase B3 [Platanthera zijinensis]|uniref:Peptide methionine sulfoxide reductase B3 n=1 Tax=Platanthera zijinensis TaxID=2320716 RepID=A0AAP0BBN6_9ASPA
MGIHQLTRCVYALPPLHRTLIVPIHGSPKPVPQSHLHFSCSTSFNTSTFPAARIGLGNWGHRRRNSRTCIAMAFSSSVHKSDDEWRAFLSPEQFRILRLKGTE